MNNNDIDRVFAELTVLSQKKGYLVFDDIEKGTEDLSVNEVDWLTNRLLTSGVEIFDDVPDTIKNGPSLRQEKKQGHPVETLLFLKYRALKATGRMMEPKGFIVYKDSEYNETTTSSCKVAIDNRRRELMRSGKMKNGVLTEDVQFGSPSTAAVVLIGNSVNGKFVWVDAKRHTLKQLLAEKEKWTKGK